MDFMERQGVGLLLESAEIRVQPEKLAAIIRKAKPTLDREGSSGVM